MWWLIYVSSKTESFSSLIYPTYFSRKTSSDLNFTGNLLHVINRTISSFFSCTVRVLCFRFWFPVRPTSLPTHIGITRYYDTCIRPRADFLRILLSTLPKDNREKEEWKGEEEHHRKTVVGTTWSPKTGCVSCGVGDRYHYPGSSLCVGSYQVRLGGSSTKNWPMPYGFL